MNARSLRPGDEITVTINPLHSGAEGGSFQPMQVKKLGNGGPTMRSRARVAGG